MCNLASLSLHYWFANYTAGPHPATCQPCLYNYTIGGDDSFFITITQSAPVCLICSNTSFNMWWFDNFFEGTQCTIPSPIPATPYMLYVTSPVATFIIGTFVTCFAGGGDNPASSIGECTIELFILMGTTTFSSNSGCSSSSGSSGCDLCQGDKYIEPGLYHCDHCFYYIASLVLMA